jgi:uncharacterized membrane protein YdjX (TVP38/TMEM64 family)
MQLTNRLLQSIEAVKLWQFAIATVCVFPKILLHTFIGSKIAELSDGDQRGHMDTRKFVLFYQSYGISKIGT